MTAALRLLRGPEASLTPVATGNRPGLSKLATGSAHMRPSSRRCRRGCRRRDYPALRALKTRERSDPAIALLDAWATVADVLTFYQERIANEGYLRTATERRSVLELARLVGYALRPGVAASVYLAYTLDKGAAPVDDPRGRAGQQRSRARRADADVRDRRAARRAGRMEPAQAAPHPAADCRCHRQQRTVSERHGHQAQANDPLLIDFGDGRGVQFCVWTAWRLTTPTIGRACGSAC